MTDRETMPTDLCDWSLRQRLIGWSAWILWQAVDSLASGVLHRLNMSLLPWAGAFAYANREKPHD